MQENDIAVVDNDIVMISSGATLGVRHPVIRRIGCVLPSREVGDLRNQVHQLGTRDELQGPVEFLVGLRRKNGGT